MEKLLQATGLTKTVLAKALFPNNKHPYSALDYAIKHKKELTRTQLNALTGLTGLTEGALIDIASQTDNWGMAVRTTRVEFKKGAYKAEYVPHLNMAYLFRDSKLVGDTVLVSSAVSLKKFLEDMDSLIASHEAQNPK